MRTPHSETETTLIKTFEQFGITITTYDIPEVLRLGADTFLLKRGAAVPDKHLDEIYLILHEMRESASPIRTQ